MNCEVYKSVLKIVFFNETTGQIVSFEKKISPVLFYIPLDFDVTNL
jgi:hypothetical protein